LIALDTNILVYAASASDNSGRHSKALDLLQQLGISGAIVALPVVGELFNVRRKKKFVDVITLIAKVEIWTAAFDCPMPQLEDYLTAAEISERCNLQFFDALIIAVSARGGATILLSEDMQDGLEVEGLRIINPFAAGNADMISAAIGPLQV
jgi:predicted nucleic acid-binding protein